MPLNHMDCITPLQINYKDLLFKKNEHQSLIKTLNNTYVKSA